MDIRKVSIGSDYKLNAMHYIVGQNVLGGSYSIHLISKSDHDNSIRIWIERTEEILLWKEFNSTIPVSIEYNINF